MTDSLPTVLVADSDEGTRRLLVKCLALEGLAAVPVDEGPGALELVFSRSFQLIVLDLDLPTLDGIAVCRAIRRSSANAGTPVLMYATNAGETDKVAGLHAGADDYVSKPFELQELTARIRALMRRRSRR